MKIFVRNFIDSVPHRKVKILAVLATVFLFMSGFTLAADGRLKPTQVKSDSIFVTILGSGSPIVSMERFGPSILVEVGGEKLLFDAGRGALLRLKQLYKSAADIKVFITHLHSDHINGLSDLFLTGWIMGRDFPMEVYGPEGTDKMMGHFYDAFEFDREIRIKDVNLPPEGAKANTHIIKPGVIYENNGIKITAIEVDHRPVVPAYGYRIDYKGKSVVLSGDTRYSENLIKHSKKVDLLIHEVAMLPIDVMNNPKKPNKMLAHHTRPKEAGKVFSKAKPKLAVYSHIVLHGVDEEQLFKQTRKTYKGPLKIGFDLMRIEVGDVIVIEHLHPE